jgi:hypothetical protein
VWTREDAEWDLPAIEECGFWRRPKCIWHQRRWEHVEALGRGSAVARGPEEEVDPRERIGARCLEQPAVEGNETKRSASGAGGGKTSEKGS